MWLKSRLLNHRTKAICKKTCICWPLNTIVSKSLSPNLASRGYLLGDGGSWVSWWWWPHCLPPWTWCSWSMFLTMDYSESETIDLIVIKILTYKGTVWGNWYNWRDSIEKYCQRQQNSYTYNEMHSNAKKHMILIFNLIISGSPPKILVNYWSERQQIKCYLVHSDTQLSRITFIHQYLSGGFYTPAQYYKSLRRRIL